MTNAKVWLLFFSTLVLLAACQSAPPRQATDLDRLQGYWQGKGPGGECSVTISGNSLRFVQLPDFWYETTLRLPAGADSKQLHATIVAESTPEQTSVGQVVVAIFRLEADSLDLGVLNSFDEPPIGPVEGDWEETADRYFLRRAEPPEDLLPAI